MTTKSAEASVYTIDPNYEEKFIRTHIFVIGPANNDNGSYNDLAALKLADPTTNQEYNLLGRQKSLTSVVNNFINNLNRNAFTDGTMMEEMLRFVLLNQDRQSLVNEYKSISQRLSEGGFETQLHYECFVDPYRFHYDVTACVLTIKWNGNVRAFKRFIEPKRSYTQMWKLLYFYPGIAIIILLIANLHPKVAEFLI